MSKQGERESNVIARAKVEITVNDFHEWVHAYPKEEYPKIMMPRSELKISAEVDFFDRDFLEYLVGMEEEETI